MVSWTTPILLISVTLLSRRKDRLYGLGEAQVTHLREQFVAKKKTVQALTYGRPLNQRETRATPQQYTLPVPPTLQYYSQE